MRTNSIHTWQSVTAGGPFRTICRSFTSLPFPPPEKDYILEGRCRIKMHETDSNGNVSGRVFYNPAQTINRDLSLLAFLASAVTKKQEHPNKEINFLDGFTASGLRAIRTRKELPQSLIDKVVACDLSTEAVRVCQQNIEINGLGKRRTLFSLSEGHRNYQF